MILVFGNLTCIIGTNLCGFNRDDLLGFLRLALVFAAFIAQCGYRNFRFITFELHINYIPLHQSGISINKTAMGKAHLEIAAAKGAFLALYVPIIVGLSQNKVSNLLLGNFKVPKLVNLECKLAPRCTFTACKNCDCSETL